MKQSIKLCEYCHREHDGSYGSGRFCSKTCRAKFIGSQANKNGKLTGHKPTCHPNPKRTGSYKCPHCGEMFITHPLKFASHVHWCDKNPKRKFYGHPAWNKGHPAWNKGLTAKTSKKIADAAQKLKLRYKTGELKGSFTGRHHSEETKRLLSKSGRENQYQRKTKKTLPYRKKDGCVVNLDSSYERYVADFLEQHDIKWIRPNPLPWIDSIGNTHNYFPDFYLVDLGIYLDPKNDYCFVAQKEKINYILDHYPNVLFLRKKQLNESDILEMLQKYGFNP